MGSATFTFFTQNLEAHSDYTLCQFMPLKRYCKQSLRIFHYVT